ncbi:hypothetical protein [Pseudobacteroides cellulosolvens]|uniref:Uncharacterized protein n=1 Tax=Pseudobacteroides cellulosolvens ATCC 35603 = DSM 2933 TaxID=398512 RepID=A0A0L6JKP8_9FIRM|nr:hypothetical protein [Pseudobacteroides cellulosolvens]KNY26359.1 hypothetical protein Bccel_1621 [Pseudobacteroides cellulosolvens ATCC 35603 = DSM 2933]
MFKVKEKDSKQLLPIIVYAVRTDKDNYSWFLIYENHKWIWRGSSTYEPWIE